MLHGFAPRTCEFHTRLLESSGAPLDSPRLDELQLKGAQPRALGCEKCAWMVRSAQLRSMDAIQVINSTLQCTRQEPQQVMDPAKCGFGAAILLHLQEAMTMKLADFNRFETCVQPV